MPATRTQRRHAGRDRRAEAERQIADSARNLLATSRFREVSVDDVMAGTGLTRTAFYRYFPDLETLLQRLLAEAREELTLSAGGWLGGTGDDAPLALAETVTDFVAAYGRQGRVLRAVMDAAAGDSDIEAAYHDLVYGFIDAVTARIEADQATGLCRGLDPRATAEALVWMTERYLAETLGRDGHADPGVIGRTLVAIWQRALYPAD
jgi:AcrR family transcriptional regulator